MRLRARGNGKGTHEGCLCCIFARCRGQKHRGNTFLMPLFGGAGQTGEGREGQTGVEENTGVTRFGGAGRILRLGGGIIVVGAQLGARCGTADGAGLGGACGGVFPVVGFNFAPAFAHFAHLPMAILSLDPSFTVGVGCLLFFYFRGIAAAGAGVIGFPAYRCAGGGLGFVVDEGVIEGGNLFVGRVAAALALAGVIGVPADFCAGRSLCFVMLEVVVVGVSVAIRLAAGRADGRCHAGGGAAGMLMQLQHLIRTIIRNSIRGIVGLEAVFIRFFNTVPRYNRHRVPCGGSVGSRDADGRSGQFIFDDDSGRRTAGIPIQVNIALASALFTIALPVAGNIDIAANGQSVRRRNINTARFSILRYAVIGNTRC